jgi:putative hydrolase of the HAD superfamily
LLIAYPRAAAPNPPRYRGVVSADCSIRALFLDFDGTVWDSESAVFEAYRRLYASHGEELPVDVWASGVGTLGGFDPVAELEQRLGRAIETRRVDDPWDRLEELEGLDGLLDDTAVRPGVRAYLDEARRDGLALGIVSSNDREWVTRHLARLGLAEGWDVIATADGDEARAKPSPALYLEALRAVGVEPARAVAIEDSPHGIAAAKAAGVFCVAVPNDVTASLDLGAADLVLDSLEELPLADVLAAAERASASEL